jgi:ABC-type multidrug transport system ATPase subunit
MFGKDPLREHRAVLQRIGYVPDVPDVYPWMTAKDLFKFLQPQYPTWNAALCAELCERLAVPLRTKFKSMSRGQGMKAMLARRWRRSPSCCCSTNRSRGWIRSCASRFCRASSKR